MIMPKSPLKKYGTAKTGAARSFALRLWAALALALAVSALGVRSSGEAQAQDAAANLSLEAEAQTAAYWLDGTVNLLLTASLRNDGDVAFAGARQVRVNCAKDGVPIRHCARTLSISLPDGFAPASETMSVRAPTGEIDFTIDYGADAPVEMKVTVPERILGADRDALTCFADKSNVGTLWLAERGIGCGGWARENVNKWDQSDPVKVWMTGLPTWTHRFRSVFNEVAALANVEVDWVARADDGEILAYVGAPSSAFSGVCVRARGEVGCSSVETTDGGEITEADILIHSGSSSFDSQSELNRRAALRAMYREAIRALTMMRARAEPGSVMEANHVGVVELSPMDKEMLRLHGHRLVTPGMDVDDVGDIAVLKADLIDSRFREILPAPALAKWKLARAADQALVNGERATFRMSSSSPDCDTEFDETGYEAANIDRALGRFGWVKLIYGRSNNQAVDFTIETAPEVVEYWHRSSGKWWNETEDDYRENTEGWRRDLADPHRLLRLVLLHLDWDEDGGLTENADGGKVLAFDLDMRTAEPGANIVRLNGSLTIDPTTYALSAFSASWTLENQPCVTHRFTATEGEIGGDFDIPTVIRQTSDALDVCVADLGATNGDLKRRDYWFRHCAPPPSADGGGGAGGDFERGFDFSIGDWLILRVEAARKSGAATRLTLARAAGDGAWTEVARGEGAGLVSAWAQPLLTPGEYRLTLTTGAHHTPEPFDLIISASETGPPPYEFLSAIPGGEHTCGLLDNGAPVCWGRNDAGQTATPVGYRFTDIAVGGRHTCALRRDGVPVCWGADEDGQSSPPRFQRFTKLAAGPDFTCGLKANGTADCWGAFTESGGSAFFRERLRSLSAGDAHVCGVTADGVSCWGANESGQATPPAAVGRSKTVAAGRAHACALAIRGGVSCWGADESGQASPPAETRFRSISAGGDLTCGIRSDDRAAVCWGEGAAASETDVQTGERFISIYANQQHACVIREDDGLPTCWGSDEHGQASPPSESPLVPPGSNQPSRPTRGTGL